MKKMPTLLIMAVLLLIPFIAMNAQAPEAPPVRGV